MTFSQKSALKHVYEAGKVHSSNGVYAFKYDGTVKKTTCFGRLWSKVTSCCSSRKHKEAKVANIYAHISRQEANLGLDDLPITREAVLQAAYGAAAQHRLPPKPTTAEPFDDEQISETDSPSTPSLPIAREFSSIPEPRVHSTRITTEDTKGKEEEVIETYRHHRAIPTPKKASTPVERELDETEPLPPFCGLITFFDPATAKPIVTTKKMMDQVSQIFKKHVQEANSWILIPMDEASSTSETSSSVSEDSSEEITLRDQVLIPHGSIVTNKVNHDTSVREVIHENTTTDKPKTPPTPGNPTSEASFAKEILIEIGEKLRSAATEVAKSTEKAGEDSLIPEVIPQEDSSDEVESLREPRNMISEVTITKETVVEIREKLGSSSTEVEKSTEKAGEDSSIPEVIPQEDSRDKVAVLPQLSRRTSEVSITKETELEVEEDSMSDEEFFMDETKEYSPK